MRLSELVIGDWFVYNGYRYVLVDVSDKKYTCVYMAAYSPHIHIFNNECLVYKLDCAGFILLKPNTYYHTVTGKVIKTGTFYTCQGNGARFVNGLPVEVDVHGNSDTFHAVDKELPDPGPDYYLLQDGDIIQKGDEFYTYGRKEWVELPDYRYGQKVEEIKDATARRPKKKPEAPITFTQVKKLWGQTIVSKNSNKKQIVYEVSDSSIGIRINHVELSAILYRYTMEDGEEIKAYLQRCN